MARPRTVSDARLIAAASAAAVQRADGSWSLAEAAEIAGVTAAAVVKRFGSKRGLLLALVTRWADDVPDYDAESVSDPLAHVREWAGEWLRVAADPRSAVGHLTLLIEEAADDEIRSVLQRGIRRQCAYLYAALRDAQRRSMILSEPAAGTVELWLDLLAGSAVKAAIERTDLPAGRALRFIEKEIDSWKRQ